MIRKNYFLRLLACLIVLIFILPVFAGCGGSSETETSNTFMELLNLVPASAVGEGMPFSFTLLDYARIYKDAGIVLTKPEDMYNAVNKDDIVMMAAASGSYITGYGRFAFEPTIKETNKKEYIGYDVTCVDAEIQFGMTPKIGVAAIGRFDPQATEDALSHQDEWPSWAKEDYTSEVYRGITIHSWGDGLQNHLTTMLVPPHIDWLGRAMPIAVTDKYLFYDPSIETIKLMIDASQNQGQSLADLTEYASLANGLFSLGAYTAVMGDESQAVGLEDYEEDNPGPLLKHFLTFGSGIGKDEKGFYTALVLYHESEANAQANNSLLRQRIEDPEGIAAFIGEPWTEGITDVQIDVNGKVLLVKMYQKSVSLWPAWFFAPYPLLVHE
jgi:hypothetical protein